jgi:chitosanase
VLRTGGLHGQRSKTRHERIVEMKKEEAHSDTSRVDTAQRVFVRNGNFDLNTPLDFAVYGEQFHIG